MAQVDLVQVIRNSMPHNASTQQAADVDLKVSRAEEKSAAQSGLPDAPPRRRGRLYATMDHLRHFFQAPVLHQTQILSYRIDMIAENLQHINAELSILARKVDALIIRSERQP